MLAVQVPRSYRAPQLPNLSGQVRFVYLASQGESLNFTITHMSSQVLNSTLHGIRNLEDLDTKLAGLKGTAMIMHAATDMELELLVATTATQEGVFTIGLTSSAPILNGTNATLPLNHTAPSKAIISSGFAVPSDTTVTNGTLPYLWLSSVMRSHSSITSPFTVGATRPDPAAQKQGLPASSKGSKSRTEGSKDLTRRSDMASIAGLTEGLIDWWGFDLRFGA
jgi:hypothetical protein